MKELNFRKLFIGLVVRECRMPMLKCVVIMFVMLHSLPLLAQYRTDLPEIEEPMRSKYDYNQAQNGQILNLGYGMFTPAYRNIWSLFFNNEERFRFCKDGTFAMKAMQDSYSTISFYDNGSTYLGSIDTENKDMNMLSKKNITFVSGYPNKTSLKLTPSLVIFNNPVRIQLENETVSLALSTNSSYNAGWIGTYSNNGLHLGTNSNSLFFIDNTQRVYIGMTKVEANKVKTELKDKYYLFVTKGILSEDLAIAPKSAWADFVFNKDYNLRKLAEVEEFINENNHLPDVPSAKQVADEGYSQHDMNKVLLQKIEELMLYTIKQEKKIAALETELENLKK